MSVIHIISIIDNIAFSEYRLIRTKGSKGEEKSENGSESTYSSGGEKDGKKNPNEEFAEKLKDLEKEFRKRMEQLQKEGKIDAKSVVFSKTLDFGRGKIFTFIT